MKKRLAIVLSVLLLLSLMPVSVAAVTGETVITVGPEGEGYSYNTIQAAIDAAADGDTIQIAAGTYDESVVVPEEKVRSITILGADSATIPTSSEV
ncbi:MAG: hypothetical protein GXY22_10345, partial [Clostridiaceae bacterium]|nr:hypothetical protein [Clostridiaceae bacterium]